jgi:hypothetical protein
VSYLKKILVLIFALGVIVSPFIFIPKVLAINEVTCISQFGRCNQNVAAKIKGAEKKKLGEATRQLKTQLSASVLVSDYSIQFKFPDRLEVRILEKKPRYALESSTLPSVALIEKDGQVTTIVQNSNLYLPSVKIDGQLPNVGEVVEEKILFALSIVYDLSSTHSVRTGEVKDERLKVEFSQELTVIFPLEGEADVLVGSLTAILSRLNVDDEGFRIDETPISVIDLRFKNPVLR